MDNFIELEYKYKADSVKLTDFVKLLESQQVNKRLDISSWDHYYVKEEDNSFQRFRQSDTPELTKKVKTKTGNNWARVEVDLPLDFSRVTKEIVTKYVELDGYKPNFSIYKNCFIFWLDDVNYVYYTVFDENLKELGRFIEVEVNKNRVNYLNSQEHLFSRGNKNAEITLQNAEKLLEYINITPQNRMKKSVFELFVRS